MWRLLCFYFTTVPTEKMRQNTTSQGYVMEFCKSDEKFGNLPHAICMNYGQLLKAFMLYKKPLNLTEHIFVSTNIPLNVKQTKNKCLVGCLYVHWHVIATIKIYWFISIRRSSSESRIHVHFKIQIHSMSYGVHCTLKYFTLALNLFVCFFVELTASWKWLNYKKKR